MCPSATTVFTKSDPLGFRDTTARTEPGQGPSPGDALEPVLETEIWNRENVKSMDAVNGVEIIYAEQNNSELKQALNCDKIVLP